MKIRKINFFNHPLFGTLEFDFTKEGKPVDTIIIAGENGTGKSLLFNTIFKMSGDNPLSPDLRDEQHVFEIELSNKEIEVLKSSTHKQYFLNNLFDDNIFKLESDFTIGGTWDQLKVYGRQNSNWVPLPSPFFHMQDMRKVIKTIFSDVEINFTPQEITNVTSKNIDIDTNKNERSTANLASEITQLLIDIQSLDALDFSEWGRRNVGKQVDEKMLDSRIRRFTSAFEYMFPSKKYKAITTNNGKKHVLFEEANREMDIAQLSSGEKQIVFRGSFLLKDRQSSKGALVLIDEPEISLHPNWQLKILNFFKKLFTDEEGEQTSQLIIATHSPFIVHNANRKDDKVIILQKNQFGKTIIPLDQKFYTWSNEQIVQEAFNLSEFLTSKKTTVFVEGETDQKYFNRCIEVFDKEDLPIEFNWIGRINDKGNAENTGDTALNQAKTFFTANNEQIRHKLILLYDCDTNKPEEDIENLHIRKMRVNTNNTIFKKGVENLLVLPESIEVYNFYKTRVKVDDYGADSTIKELDKTALCHFICNDLPNEELKGVFKLLNEELDRIAKCATS